MLDRDIRAQHAGLGRNMDEPLGLLPFVPSGADFEKSRALFREPGFQELWAASDYVGFRAGGAKFILQAFDKPEFASNLMIKLEVSNLDDWWTVVSAKQLESRFSGFRMNPPTQVPWGREVTFIDLAGVCWHVGPA